MRYEDLKEEMVGMVRAGWPISRVYTVFGLSADDFADMRRDDEVFDGELVKAFEYAVGRRIQDLPAKDWLRVSVPGVLDGGGSDFDSMLEELGVGMDLDEELGEMEADGL